MANPSTLQEACFRVAMYLERTEADPNELWLCGGDESGVWVGFTRADLVALVAATGWGTPLVEPAPLVDVDMFGGGS